MLEKLTKVLPVTTAVILFLYISGGFYLISFWNTFGINISNIVGISEIPKSFIRPFAFAALLIFYQFLYINMMRVTMPRRFFIRLSRTILKNYNRIVKFLYMFCGFFFAAAVFLFRFYRYSPQLFTPLLIISLCIIAISISISKRVRNVLRGVIWAKFILFTIVYTPILSLFFGFIDGAKVYNNSNKSIIVTTHNNQNDIYTKIDSIPLKLIGFLGDKLIVGSLDNKKVFVLNQSAFDVVELDKVDSSNKPDSAAVK